MANTKKETKKGYKALFTAEKSHIKVELNYTPEQIKDNWLGYCTITIGGLIAIKVSLMRSKGGKVYFLMPSHKKGDEYVTDVIPCSKVVAAVLYELANEVEQFINGNAPDDLPFA